MAAAGGGSGAALTEGTAVDGGGPAVTEGTAVEGGGPALAEGTAVEGGGPALAEGTAVEGGGPALAEGAAVDGGGPALTEGMAVDGGGAALTEGTAVDGGGPALAEWAAVDGGGLALAEGVAVEGGGAALTEGMAVEGGGGEGAAVDGSGAALDAEVGGGGPALAAAPGRAQVFSTVVDTFLEKLVAAGSYQRFVNCYRCFYKLQPQLTRSIYDQFISQLQASIKEEIQEVKNEGNLEGLFSSLDKIVEEAKDREEPAWRPSGIPEQDVRSAMVPYLLKHRSHLRRVLREKEEENRKVAEAVLMGRDRIAELQQLIQARQQAWQAITKEQRELIMTFQEPQ